MADFMNKMLEKALEETRKAERSRIIQTIKEEIDRIGEETKRYKSFPNKENKKFWQELELENSIKIRTLEDIMYYLEDLNDGKIE